MSEKTMFNQHLVGHLGMKLLAFVMVAMSTLYFLTTNDDVRDKLLAIDSAVYFKNVLLGLGGVCFGYIFLYRAVVYSALKRIKNGIQSRFGEEQNKSLELDEYKATNAEVEESRWTIDWIANLLCNDISAWATQTYWLLVSCKVELEKIELIFPNQFIIRAYLSFISRCMDRLESLHVPANFQLMVESIRQGGDEFLDDSLYPYIKSGIEGMPLDTPADVMLARVVRLFLSDHEEYRLFPAIKPIVSESRLDDVQVIELESLVAHKIDGRH